MSTHVARCICFTESMEIVLVNCIIETAIACGLVDGIKTIAHLSALSRRLRTLFLFPLQMAKARTGRPNLATQEQSIQPIGAPSQALAKPYALDGDSGHTPG